MNTAFWFRACSAHQRQKIETEVQNWKKGQQGADRGFGLPIESAAGSQGGGAPSNPARIAMGPLPMDTAHEKVWFRACSAHQRQQTKTIVQMERRPVRCRSEVWLANIECLGVPGGGGGPANLAKMAIRPLPMNTAHEKVWFKACSAHERQQTETEVWVTQRVTQRHCTAAMWQYHQTWAQPACPPPLQTAPPQKPGHTDVKVVVDSCLSTRSCPPPFHPPSSHGNCAHT
jgi:hypothetical protein